MSSTPEHSTSLVFQINDKRLSFDVSPNLFNLTLTEPRQQMALSIKKVAALDKGGSIDKQCGYYLPGNELKSGHFYIVQPECFFIEFKTLLKVIESVT